MPWLQKQKIHGGNAIQQSMSLITECSLITGRTGGGGGGLRNDRRVWGASEVLPLQKGGGGSKKSCSHPEGGGAGKVLGIFFNMEA